MKKVEVKEKTATSAKVWFNMEINPVVFSINLKYTLTYFLNPPNGLTWKWVAGDMPSVKGSWTFLPLEGGKKTLAFFRITEDLKALSGIGGMGVRSAINIEPTLEPSILSSQARIMARGIRIIANMPESKRKEKMAKCP